MGVTNTHMIVADSLRNFAHRHDEIPAFHAAYLALTLIAAALLNLGVFLLLIVTHMCLDIVKYRELHHMTWKQTLYATVHESLLDVTLLLVALVVSVYLHHSVGLVSLSGLIRAELTLVRFFGTILPKFFILEHLLKVCAHMQHYLHHAHPQVGKGFSTAEKYYMCFIVICVYMLFNAANFMGVDPEVVRWVIFWELVPWNL